MNQTIEQQVQKIRQNELEHERERAEIQQQQQERLTPEPPLEATEAYEDMREVVRAAFMTHPAATEADFERCWPALRDEVFKQHALHMYNAHRAQKS